MSTTPSSTIETSRQLLVVPCGSDPKGGVSPPYRAVLELTAQIRQRQDTVLLTPGNTFTGDPADYEHLRAYHVLRDLEVPAEHIAVPTLFETRLLESGVQDASNLVKKAVGRLMGKPSGYITTGGNARWARETADPDQYTVLLAYAPQMARALMAFQQEGVRVDVPLSVPLGRTMDESEMHPSLSYYCSPQNHARYEWMARMAMRCGLVD